MPSFPAQFNPAKIQRYLFRLPLFTRIILLLIIAFWILELQSAWDVPAWGGLVPEKVNLTTSTWPILVYTPTNVILVYRLNTYPLIHVSFLHFILNAFALVPLLERFEADHGTLLSATYFGGRELGHYLSWP